MLPSLRSLALVAVAGAGSLLFSGCYDDGPYYGRAAYYDRGPGPGYYERGPGYYERGPAYYADAGYYDDGPDVDFYYVGGRPYSRVYGPLIVRDGGYYYSHGGSYVVYDRHRVAARGDYRRGYTTRNDYAGTGRYAGGTYPYTTGRTAARGTYYGTARGTYPNGRTTVRGQTTTTATTTTAKARTRARNERVRDDASVNVTR